MGNTAKTEDGSTCCFNLSDTGPQQLIKVFQQLYISALPGGLWAVRGGLRETGGRCSLQGTAWDKKSPRSHCQMSIGPSWPPS